jgi:hypothetical protein
MQEAPTSDWAAFTQHFIRDLGPPIDQETIGDLAPLRHTDTVHDYVIIFTACGLYVGIASTLHQVHLFITDIDYSLLMMIVAPQSAVQGWQTMLLAGAIFGTGDIPFHMDAETPQIDAFLFDIGNDIDIVLGTPWLASLGCLTEVFTTMELHCYHNGHPITFTNFKPRRTPATVFAPPVPPPVRRAPRAAPPSPPRDIMNRASRAGCLNALDHVDTTSSIFASLRRGVLQQQELRFISPNITNGTTAPTWLQVLLQGGPTHMALPVLGYRSPSTTPQPNAAPTGIFLGSPWPQGSTVYPTTVVFINNLGRQLPRIDDNSKTAPARHAINNPAIITQLHLAAMNEIQIISATIVVNAAAPAWSPQQGVIFYNGCHDIPTTSPLL